MKINRKLISALVSVILALNLFASPASAAEYQAEYLPAIYSDIAVTAYSRMLELHNGAIAVQNDEDLWGLADLYGNMILPFQFKLMESMGNGFYRVSYSEYGYNGWEDDCREGIIDSTGAFRIPLGDHWFSRSKHIIRQSFDNGDPDVYYHNTDLSPATEEEYLKTFPQYEDYAWPDLSLEYDHCTATEYGYILRSDSESSYAFVTLAGEVLIPYSTYDYIYATETPGFLRIVNYGSNHQTGVVDVTSGTLREAIPMGLYSTISDECPGVFQVSTDSGRGFVSSDNVVIVPLAQYDYLGDVNAAGYVATSNYDGSNYGEKSNFDTHLYHVSDGLIGSWTDRIINTTSGAAFLSFSLNGTEFGCMDAAGNTLLSPLYTSLYSIGDEGYIRVRSKDSNKYGLISSDYQMLMDTVYSDIFYWGENDYQYCIDRKYGINTIRDGVVTEKIPCIYKDIDWYSANFMSAYDGSTYRILNGSDQCIIGPTSEYIELFRMWFYDLDQQTELALEWDNYTGPVLPYISETADGYVTTYADYLTGEVQGTLSANASNLTEDGWFAYEDPTTGKFGIGRITGFAAPFTGLKQDSSGAWQYYVDGVLQTNYTGLVYFNDVFFYVENGTLNTNYTGLVEFYGAWYYVEGGVINFSFSGLTYYNGTFFYIQNGVLDTGFTGLVEFCGTWYYVEGGIINFGFTGLTYFNGIFFYVQNGVLDAGFTGLVEFYGAWYYVEGGVINFAFSGLTYYNGTFFLVTNGVLNTGYVGLIEFYGVYYYVQGGVIDFFYNGTAYTPDGTAYNVVNGIAQP